MSSISLERVISCLMPFPILLSHSTVDVDSPSLPGVLSSLTLEPTWLVKVH